MKRPNKKKDYIFGFNGRLGKTIYLDKKYVKELEKYIDYLESKFNNVGLADVRLSLMQEVWTMRCRESNEDFDKWLHKEVNDW